MKTLTVFTPAYNRAHLLPRLYESLCRQTSDDFQWLLVDDGSSDNTKELVAQWISENRIIIRYIYQENQGMHGAHNTAYKNIDTELNTCIDSDDYMPDNAVELILKKWNTVDKEKYAGIIGLDAIASGAIIGTEFQTAYTTLEDFYLQGGKGDKKLVYRTDVIKRYPEYPIFEGEKYVGLGTKYLFIDKEYQLATINEVLVIVEYQEDGSSNTMFAQYLKYPKGFIYNRITSMKYSKSMKRKFIEAIHYVSSCIILKKTNFLNETPEKLLTLVAIPFGVMLYLLIQYKVRVK
ncbi:glycosyltransferase family A protein [Flavobacterium sp. GSA192]|uniref:glycosyltransferase family A protein n=1 Tax=Flavobacterium sp. GSA192 TaxID=2576304 RepID=UPI00112DC7F1|nr:glycosyltransferase family 2 protein [Flavobacterium sp. GSA192]